MSFLKATLGLGSAVATALLLSQVSTAAEVPTSTQAAEPAIAPTATIADSLQQIKQYTASQAQSQVTSVSQLSDVQPTDWAFQALQSLVERYGVIAGYPDGKFRGNRAMTRYEFAAGLNAALDRVNELIAAGTADLVSKEDLATLQKLQEEFSAELATLRGRVDALEARTATLEAQQFSTTTKLTGNVVFNLGGVFGDKKPSGAPLDKNITFSQRARLIFNTSFTGKDLLLTRLEASNGGFGAGPAAGTSMTNLANTSNTGNTFTITELDYRFPIGKKGTFFVEANGFLDLFVPTLNPIDGDANTVLTGFAQRSPIYFPGGASGVGFNYNLSDSINIGGGYLGGSPNPSGLTANSPTTGLFGGNYGALAQLTIRPSKQFAFGLTYLRAYDNGSNTGTPGGPFGGVNSQSPFGALPSTTDGYGVTAQYLFSPKFNLSGWYYFANAKGAGFGGSADVQSWALTLSFPDLGKMGNLGGITVGMPSKVTSSNFGTADKDSSLLIEAFYRYQLNNNIGITPGLVVLTNPEHNSANPTIYMGVLRTTFDF